MAALLGQIELPPEFADRYPAKLSDGQKQRVGIVRALAAEPKLIICDEVTSALDQLVADEILKLLLRIQNATRVAYLLINHDLATVKAIAHAIVVMDPGKIVEQGASRGRTTTIPMCSSKRSRRCRSAGSRTFSPRAR